MFLVTVPRNSWKFAKKRPIMKSFYQSNRFTMLNLCASEKKNRFIHFPGDVRKKVLF